MSEIANLLTIVGVFTAIQFIASSLKNIRDAIRLVPIGGVKPSLVEEYKTVPLCFVGGETVLTNWVTYLYGRLWIRPKARKQAALCDRIVFFDNNRTPNQQHRNMEPGHRIQVRVSEGENSRHIRRSARRCRIGNELILAMLFPTQSREEFQTQVRCVTVRARARSSRDKPDMAPTRVIEWEVIQPAGIGTSMDSSLKRGDVPAHAFWLISKEVDREDDLDRPRSGGVFYSYGSNRLFGFISWAVTLFTRTSVLIIVVAAMGITLSITDSDRILVALSIVMPIIVLYKLIHYVVEQELPERFRTQAPTVRQRVRIFRIWTTTVYWKLEWHGSTRRSLAIGNRIRMVGLWQQFRFLCWEPFVNWLMRMMPFKAPSALIP